ncbi:MAG: NOL1/NOP2/sun family putative RNA methylase [Nanoarchaeota archaeon]
MEQKTHINPHTSKPFKFQPKPEFEARMNSLLKDEADKEAYWKVIHEQPVSSIRCNTLKITPQELLKKFEEKNWKIKVPFKQHPEIMIIESDLKPGELGRSKEHLLGYYYVQEISSMLPILALKPTKEDSFVDLCASPGSKTTQAAAMMENKGNIIANDDNLGRMIILASNLEKCGVSNTLVMRHGGVQLCEKLRKLDFQVDKILVDAPCSGEGTIRSSPKTLLMWNEKMIKVFSRIQKSLASAAIELLKENGEMIYSTCTHAPEENEEIIQHLLDNYNIKIEDVKKELPVKARDGLTSWNGKDFSPEIKKCARIYPQDNNTEGFFVCKIKKLPVKTKEGDEDDK